MGWGANRCFSVLQEGKGKKKRTTRAFSRVYRPGERREERGGGKEEERGEEKRSSKAKVITEADRLQSITQDR